MAKIQDFRGATGTRTPADSFRMIEGWARKHVEQNGGNYQETLELFKLAYSQYLTLPED